ncbi:unnamed protein product (macronuclear) [Paramecium tetraurelia]|uniref:Uncharacterized protein n=1 Tax=Paramecium tetraurelia TaxID=5888 RepID=A0DRD1_PARTE|nr:uncharacterized protein GSPATT00019315001 [Paramecium tetraurelia]CAK85598.1 unnamed protein product [Paramecium tetraurelia]|eukprot:XP_001452995.1 hypothetical protein (macronuclear) [Paramecium tetraurelia strain d4-2]
MIIKSKATVTKIKLPQIAMNHVRERSTHHSKARSLNPSQSPTSKMLQPTTPLHSTHHKNSSYYHYSSIMKIDQVPLNEVEMFNCLYKPLDATTTTKNKESPMKRIRNNSNENFQNHFMISRDPRRSAPDLDMYPNYLKKPQQQNQTKSIEIREKIMEIYNQVVKLLQNHKGYVRQVEKKQAVITLVKLRKEFMLLNQDYNEYYVLPVAEPDLDFKNRMEMLINWFQPHKLQKSNRINLLFNFDESFNTAEQSQIMQLLSDQFSDQDQNYSTSQQSCENLSEVSGAISQSKRNAQQNRTTKGSVSRQSKLINPIEQLQIQQIQVDQQKQKHKNSKQDLKDSKTQIPRKYTKLSIEDIIDQQEKNANINYFDDDEEPSENGTGDKGTDTRRRAKRDAKMISRKNAILGANGQPVDKKNYRINTDGQMVSDQMSDQDKSSENRRQSEETNRNGLENREDLLSNQEQIDEILNQVENDLITYQKIDENDNRRKTSKAMEFNMDNNQQGQSRFQRQQTKYDQNLIIKQSQIYKTEAEFLNQTIDQTGLIEALYNCQYIYDSRILDLYRIDKQYTTWDDDIDYIYCGEYQFR